ncbi:hypothetical protein EDD22DRAFT_924654 [Suillus occidentalis]|nr:hypothetical protein EDD22DRAFT_924654 [Suillus occidentalis]
MLAIATDQDIQIYVGEALQTKFKSHSHATLSLAWSPDRTRLLSGGDDLDPTIREWDTSSWTQVGDPWTGHTYKVNSISVHSSGTYAVSASNDNTVRLWQLSDKQTIAIFQHAASVVCAAFSADGTHILSGGYDKRVAVWAAPKGTLAVALAAVVDASKELVSTSLSNERMISKAEQSLKAEQSFKAEQSLSTMIEQSSLKSEQSLFKAEQGVSKIEQGAFMAERGIARVGQSALQFEQDVSMDGTEGVSKFEQGISMVGQAISKKLTITSAELLATATTIRTAFITGDLFTAEKVLTQDITVDAKNFASYANRSFIMARKFDWNNALKDATKSLAIQTSLPGYIAQGIAFCGKQLVDDARAAFDLAFTFTQGNMDATAFVYLIKAIALFNANRIKEALLRVDRLSADSSADPLACGIVVASLRFQLGTIALNGGRHSEAVEHFTAAVEASTFLAQSAPPSSSEVFTVLFGWNIETLWQMSNQKLILTLLGAGMLGEAFESYRFAMDASDETTKTNLQSWVLKR